MKVIQQRNGDAGQATHSLSVADGACVILISGEIDILNAHELMGWLIAAVAPAHGQPLVLDLADLRFIDSTGVQSLVEAHAYADRQHVSPTMVNPQPMVRRVITILGMSETLGLS